MAKSKLDEVRYKAKTDLFFLAHDILGYTKMTEQTHRPMCDFFVQKNPDLSIEEQDVIKERLELAPRGSYKSTINICDSIQWILINPNIRILILTGAYNLAQAFVSELVSHFIRKNPPSYFEQLFPEFCLEDRRGSAMEFVCPAKTKDWKEPTVMANSIESNLSGWHFEVIKCDDVVTDDNSRTPEQLQKVISRFHMASPLLNPNGYMDVLGTRYAPDDLYGNILSSNDGDVQVFMKPAMEIDEHAREKQITDLTEEDVTLFFPEELSLKFLKRKYRKDSRMFWSQYMNDPYQSSGAEFDLQMMRNATIPPQMLPQQANTFIWWDLAYSRKKQAAFTVGAVGKIQDNKLYIVDVIRGQWRPHEMSYQIVDAIRKWNPILTSIEDSLGAQWLMPEMQRIALGMNIELKVEWVQIEHQTNAKEDRIRECEPDITNGRLFFANTIPCLEDLYKEFIELRTISHKDIADAISQLRKKVMPGVVTLPASAQQAKAWTDLQKKDLHDRLYGMGRYEQAQKPMQSCNPYQLDDILGGLNG